MRNGHPNSLAAFVRLAVFVDDFAVCFGPIGGKADLAEWCKR
jgi:hypothetical protein